MKIFISQFPRFMPKMEPLKRWVIWFLFCSPLLWAGCVNLPEHTTSTRAVRLLQQTNPDEPSEILEVYAGDNFEANLKKAVSTQFTFYGRVVDENNDPLAGVPVDVRVVDRTLDPFVFPFVGWRALPGVVTDQSGRFTLKGLTGGAIIADVEEEGYWEEHHGYKIWFTAPELQGLNETPIPTFKEPAVFRLVPKPADAVLEMVSTGAVRIEPNGFPIELDLIEHSRYSLPVGEGTIRVFLTKEDPDSDGKYDWKCRIEVPGGGVQPRRQVFIKEAPEDGYEPYFEFGFKAQDPKWDHREDMPLFIRTKDKLYALIELRARTRGEPYISLFGVYNPTGARYGE